MEKKTFITVLRVSDTKVFTWAAAQYGGDIIMEKIWFADWQESVNNAGSGAFIATDAGVFPLRISGHTPVEEDIAEFKASGPNRPGVFFAPSGRTFREIPPEELEDKSKVVARAWASFLNK